MLKICIRSLRMTDETQAEVDKAVYYCMISVSIL